MNATPAVHTPPRPAVVLFRGIGAAVALVALLLGPPLALTRWTSWPVNGAPDWDQIGDLPTAVVSDSALLATLTIALWAAWALFAACVAGEAVAEIRSRVPRRSIPAGPIRLLARTLVATVAMSIGSLAPLARTAPASQAQTVTVAPTPQPVVAAPPEPDDPSAAPASSAANLDDERVIRVEPDDDPWTLAETHLGDGTRWQQLWDANRDRVQPDGERWTDRDHIKPGWTLVIPATADPVEQPSRQVVVASGDTAWDLAATHLGEGHRWPELFDANRGRAQPDGRIWSDPDLLHVGWRLTIPSPAGRTPDAPVVPDANGASDVPAPTTGEPSGLSAVEDGEPSDTDEPAVVAGATDSALEDEDGTSDASTASPTTPEVDSSSDSASDADVDASGPRSSASGSADEPPTSTPMTSSDRAGHVGSGSSEEGDDTTGDTSSGAPAVPLLGVGGTVLTVALARAWHRRRARRAARLPVTAVAPPAPRGSRAVARELLTADDADADRLDAALANLAADLRPRSGQRCVQPRIVQVDADRIEVMLDQPEPAAPGPWRPEASGLIWVLDAADGADLEPPDEDPHPLPALATIGTDTATLHMDLEAFGVVSLVGDPTACEALARSIVTELAGRADGTMAIEIVGASLADMADGLPGVRHVAGWDGVDTDLIGRLVDEVDAGRWPHTFAARASGRRAHAWVPFVWITAPEDHPHLQDAIDAVASRPGASSVIVVVGGEAGRGLRIELDDTGSYTIGEFGLAGRAQRVDGETVDRIVDLLDDAEQVPVAQTLDFPTSSGDQPAATGDVSSSDTGDSTPATLPGLGDNPAATASPAALVVGNGAGYRDPDFDVLVRVCGDIRIDGGTAALPNLETAVAVYLALQGETTVERVRDAVWNGTAVTRKRVRNVLSNVRNVLGDAIRWADEGRLALGDTMTTDLELIRRRLDYAARQSDPATRAAILHDGLDWVTGRVCTYPETAGGWSWIDLDNWMPHVESLVGTLARDLAQLYLDLDDPESACWAASRGIEATGQREQLTVLLARGYEAAGDEPATRAALAAYLAYANEYGIDDHSDTLRTLLDRHPLPGRTRAAG